MPVIKPRPVFKPFSVCLQYPQGSVESAPETFYDFVTAKDRAHAVQRAYRACLKGNRWTAKQYPLDTTGNPGNYEFSVVLVLEGHHKGI